LRNRQVGLERGGELQLPSPEGVQCGDIYHPHHESVAAGGDPGISDRTSKATVDHHTNAPP
jgi:hypothetical protein